MKQNNFRGGGIKTTLFTVCISQYYSITIILLKKVQFKSIFFHFSRYRLDCFQSLLVSKKDKENRGFLLFIFLRSEIESKAFMIIDGGVFINGLPIIVVLEAIATFPPFILKFLIVNISSYFGLLGFVRYYRQHWSWLICDT